jgi:hypothetical protein
MELALLNFTLRWDKFQRRICVSNILSVPILFLIHIEPTIKFHAWLFADWTKVDTADVLAIFYWCKFDFYLKLQLNSVQMFISIFSWSVFCLLQFYLTNYKVFNKFWPLGHLHISTVDSATPAQKHGKLCMRKNVTCIMGGLLLSTFSSDSTTSHISIF